MCGTSTAARPEDYHRRAPGATELDRIFRLESERTISDDWVVCYDNRFFQLAPQSRHYPPARGKVWVCEKRDGSLAIEYRGRALRWREIPPPTKPRDPEVRPSGKTGVSEAAQPPRLPKRKWVPPADHPWRQAAGAPLLSGSGLRSALRAPQDCAPAGTRKQPQHSKPQPQSFRGDTSNEVRKGTFLKSFDPRFRSPLTQR